MNAPTSMDPTSKDTPMQRTFPLTNAINLSVRLGHGSIDIRTADGLDAATVELTGGEQVVARTRVEMSGPTLHVHAERQGGLPDLLALGRAGKGESVHAVITVPSGTAMRLATLTAPVTVNGRCGSADVVSGAGNIDLETVDGDVTLRYGASRARVGRVSGSAKIRSGAGSAELGEVDGDLHAGCGRGTLTVGVSRGTVHSRSGAGQATLGAVYGDVDLASGSGGVSIGLPSGVTAKLDVLTGSGTVRSDLPVADQPARREGAITVRARTGQGDVRVHRAT